MKIENIGSKIIGIGEVTVLPGETKDIPKAYETSPILEVYRQCGAAKIIGTPSEVSRNVRSDTEEKAISRKKAETKKKAEDGKKAEDEAEALRKTRLAMLNGISEDGLIKLAGDLGITFADCKDSSDMLKKVEEALKK